MGEVKGKYIVKTWDFVLVAVGTALYTASGFIGALTATLYGISWFYPPYIITALWMIWFGPFWGAVTNALGLLFVSIPYGSPPIPVGLVDAIFLTPLSVLPAIIFVALKGDPQMRGAKSLIVYLVSVIISTFPQGWIWMYEIAFLIGWFPVDFVLSPAGTLTAIVMWEGHILSAVIAIPIFWALTPVVKNTGLYVEGYFLRRAEG